MFITNIGNVYSSLVPVHIYIFVILLTYFIQKKNIFLLLRPSPVNFNACYSIACRKMKSPCLEGSDGINILISHLDDSLMLTQFFKQYKHDNIIINASSRDFFNLK